VRVRTNGSGDYRVEVGGFGSIWAYMEGYELNFQVGCAWGQCWPKGSLPTEVVLPFRLQRVRTFTAGESIAISVDPDSSRCTDLEDLWVLDHRCETVRVTTNTAGTLVVQAHAGGTGGAEPTLLWATSSEFGGPAERPGPGTVSVPMKRGGTAIFMVGVPDGQRSQRFDVTTALR
jgi:hypothetical protein